MKIEFTLKSVIVLIFLPCLGFSQNMEIDFSSSPYTKAGSVYLASADDVDIAGYNRGVRTISRSKYIIGGAVGTIFGLGVGHAIQGRWMSTGWIHTLLQAGVGIGLGIATAQGKGDQMSVVALLAITLFAIDRIWEIVDVWWLPSSWKTVDSTNMQEDNNTRQEALLSSHNDKTYTPWLSFQLSL